MLSESSHPETAVTYGFVGFFFLPPNPGGYFFFLDDIAGFTGAGRRLRAASHKSDGTTQHSQISIVCLRSQQSVKWIRE